MVPWYEFLDLDNSFKKYVFLLLYLSIININKIRCWTTRSTLVCQIDPHDPTQSISCWSSEGIPITMFFFQTAAFIFFWLTTTLFCSLVFLSIHNNSIHASSEHLGKY